MEGGALQGGKPQDEKSKRPDRWEGVAGEPGDPRGLTGHVMTRTRMGPLVTKPVEKQAHQTGRRGETRSQSQRTERWTMKGQWPSSETSPGGPRSSLQLPNYCPSNVAIEERNCTRPARTTHRTVTIPQKSDDENLNTNLNGSDGVPTSSVRR